MSIHWYAMQSPPEELLFISTTPWLTYTALVQPVPIPADSNPRITWGKYFTQEGKTLVPQDFDFRVWVHGGPGLVHTLSGNVDQAAHDGGGRHVLLLYAGWQPAL